MENGIALQKGPRLAQEGALLHKGRHPRHLEAWPAQLPCHCRCVVGPGRAAVGGMLMLASRTLKFVAVCQSHSRWGGGGSNVVRSAEGNRRAGTLSLDAGQEKLIKGASIVKRSKQDELVTLFPTSVRTLHLNNAIKGKFAPPNLSYSMKIVASKTS